MLSVCFIYLSIDYINIFYLDLNSRNKNVYQPSNFNLDSEIKADVNSNISIENKPSRPLPRYDQLNRSPDHKPSSSSSSSPDVNSNQKVKRDLELRVPPPARLDYLQLRNNIDHKEIDSQSISVQGSKLPLSVQSSFDNNNNNRRKYNQNKDNLLVNIDEKPQDSGDVMDKNLDKLLEGSNTIVSELITRLETLKTLRSQWEEGNVIEVKIFIVPKLCTYHIIYDNFHIFHLCRLYLIYW